MTTPCAVQPRILIADDQTDLLDALRLLLKNEGIEMETVTSPEAVIEAVATGRFDLLLMDLNYTGDTTSGREGIDLLARVQELDQLLPIVVMTGWRLSHGFCTKSRTPRRIASTAMSTEPQPVITTIGSS